VYIFRDKNPGIKAVYFINPAGARSIIAITIKRSRDRTFPLLTLKKYSLISTLFL